MIFWRIYVDIYDAGPGNSYAYNHHNWQLIYDPTKSPYDPVNENAHDITLNMEMSAAGSLSFTLEKDHPMYGLFSDGGSILRKTVRAVSLKDPSVQDFGGADWFGRVTRISIDYYGSTTVECEGALSWLNDIYVRPIRYTHTEWGKEGSGYWSGTYNIVDDPQPLSTVIGDAMSIYNTYNVPKRRISYGGIQGTLYLAKMPSTSTNNYPKSYGVTDYKKFLDFLNECLDLDECAGLWWYVVFVNNCLGVGIQIIDLTDTNSIDDSSPKIDIDLNLVDHTEEYSADDVFTSIIPTGNNGIHRNDSYYTYTVDADGNYTATPAQPPAQIDYCDTTMVSMGRIEVIKDFDCDMPPDLNTLGWAYAQQYFVSPPGIVTLRAVDMALVQDVSKIGINSIVGLKRTHIDDWKSGKTYAVNAKVKYDNVYYKCATANSDTEFDNSKWTAMTNSELYGIYRCIKANINIDDPGESEYTLIPATSSGASYYKRQLSLSRALAQVSRRLPDSIKNQDEIDSGLANIKEIMKEGNRVTLIYGDGSKSDVIDMFQDSASAQDPTQTKHYKPLSNTVTTGSNSGGNA